MYQVTGIPAFSDNYIWLCHALPAASQRTTPGRTAIIDPGDAAPVKHALARMQLQPAAILITHGHRDHVGGVEELVATYRIPVYGPSDKSITCISHRLHEGDQVSLEATTASFSVMEVPGHTQADIAYYCEGILFCGDTLFTGGCGRVFAGTARQLYHALQRISALPDDTRIYCAHEYTLENLQFALLVEPGNRLLHKRMEETMRLRSALQPTVPASLALEKDTNPFLRCHVPAVIESVERFAGKKMDSEVEVFIAVRYWRDTWKS